MKRELWFLCAGTLLLAGCQRPPERLWSGYVEGEYVYVASPIGGALTTLAVQRGQNVARGAALFALDSASERAAREEAQARAQSAQAQADNTDKGRRKEEIAVTQAQLVQARAQAALASSELKRAQQLVTQGFISPSRLDDARTAASQSQAHVAELEAALRVRVTSLRSVKRTEEQPA